MTNWPSGNFTIKDKITKNKKRDIKKDIMKHKTLIKFKRFVKNETTLSWNSFVHSIIVFFFFLLDSFISLRTLFLFLLQFLL